MEQIPNQVISAVVSPCRQQIMGQKGSKRGTPGTAAAAVRFDIQAWLIYGAGETVPLLWVSARKRSWQFLLYLHVESEVIRRLNIIDLVDLQDAVTCSGSPTRLIHVMDGCEIKVNLLEKLH